MRFFSVAHITEVNIGKHTLKPGTSAVPGAPVLSEYCAPVRSQGPQMSQGRAYVAFFMNDGSSLYAD